MAVLVMQRGRACGGAVMAGWLHGMRMSVYMYWFFLPRCAFSPECMHSECWSGLGVCRARHNCQFHGRKLLDQMP